LAQRRHGEQLIADRRLRFVEARRNGWYVRELADACRRTMRRSRMIVEFGDLLRL